MIEITLVNGDKYYLSEEDYHQWDNQLPPRLVPLVGLKKKVGQMLKDVDDEINMSMILKACKV